MDSELYSALSKAAQTYSILSEINRFSTVVKIKNRNVAEHTAYTNMILIVLRRFYDFDLGAALIYSTLHDVGEASVGDIEYNIKNIIMENPKAAVSVLNKELEAYDIIYGSGTANDIAVAAKDVMFCDLADRLEALFFIKQERMLGNNNRTLDKIHASIEKDIGEKLANLEGYRI